MHKVIDNIVDIIALFVALLVLFVFVKHYVDNGTVHIERLTNSTDVMFTVVDVCFVSENRTSIVLQYDNCKFATIVNKKFDDSVKFIGNEYSGTVFSKKEESGGISYTGFNINFE